jgi:hypothetical protein
MKRFLVLLLLLLPVQTHAQLEWPEITRETRPWTRWWWLGSAVDSTNLSAELEDLARAGFGGVEVTSIYGIKGQEHRHIPYFSEKWIAMLGHAASEANRLGMGLDMPPGSGWKMGGPEVPIDQASRSLRVVADTASDGRVAWSAEIRNNREQVKRPAPGGEGNVVDVLSEDAVEAYFEYFGGKREQIPDGIVRSFFHDSYEYSGDGAVELFETFEENRGYDLREHAAALAGQGDPEYVARVKSDYRQTIDEMVLENLVEEFTDFAHDNGSLSRNQAHGSPGNLLDLYAASDIPETEIFGPLTGTDADPLISKFASSAAHVAGKPRTSAESMTWLGEHWTVSLNDVKQAVDGLFVSGVNHVFFHGTAYSPDEAAWPGWLFYASTQFNDRNAFWRDIPALNEYIARVQSVMQSGVPDNDVLLYWPVFDNWHDAEARPRMDFRVHDPVWFHGKPLGEVAKRLWEGGYGFDYVSDRLLEEAVEVEDGMLEAEGGARYDAVLVPPTQMMPLETFERLVELARAGGTVIFVGGLPADVPGLQDLEARRAALALAKSRLQFDAGPVRGVRLERVGAGFIIVGEDAEVERMLEGVEVRPEAVVDHEGVRVIRRRWERGYLYFITNARGEEAVDGWLPLGVAAASVAILDPMSGRAGMARTRGNPQRRDVRLQLAPGASLLLRTFDEPVEAEAWRYLEPTGEAVTLSGDWRVEFIDGGPARPEAFTARELASWTARGGAAESFAGTAKYTLRFDAPAGGGEWLLDLGRVAESARVALNGQELGTVFARPFTVPVPAGALRPTGNVLEVEVTNLSANRIRDLDRRGVEWRIFHDINFVNIDYRPFDASGWEVRESGLLGPVRLVRVQ